MEINSLVANFSADVNNYLESGQMQSDRNPRDRDDSEIQLLENED